MKLNSCKCDTCSHNQVCSLKNEYHKVYETITDINTEDDFNTSLICDHYDKEKDWSARI